MKYFFDTEFLETRGKLDFISIGIVCEDGRDYYAVCSEFDLELAKSHVWLWKNVLPQLQHPCHWKKRKTIAQEIIDFVGDEPEFWADYAAYDWVVLCQIFGTMMDLPAGWPMFCRDIQQLRDWIPFESDEIENRHPHHALHDARECRDRYLLMDNHSSVEVSLYRRE